MDYANRQRVKLWGQARVVDDDPALLERLADPAYPGRVERAVLFEIEAWDVNCQQQIHRRFSERDVAPVIERLQARVRELEEKLKAMESVGRAS
jgi:predicted pyridoxine 5'-phosphate oxidase superfamily flavin-nucleotide-binding protein